jgi:protein-S-isoprenylcysteine O-methyltransferase Ste14
MNRSFVIRALSLYVPLLAAFVLWNWRKPARAEATGAVLASAWNLPALLALNLLAGRFGWWRFNALGAVFLGTPVDLWLGWAVLWGCVAALLFRRTPVWIVCGYLGFFDWMVMPLCTPVVVLDKFWWVGELVGLASCFVPAVYFARWTCQRTHVTRRATLQFLAFSGMLALGTVLALTVSQRSWSFDLHSKVTQIALQLLFILALPGLTAVQEFALAGEGTPLPYDPPSRLVTSGIYAYIANPMQLSTTLLLFGLGVGLHSKWLFFAGLISVVYCFGLAAWNENADLKLRYGDEFVKYRSHVRNWLPRWRPWIASPSRVYLSEDCFKCSQMAAFLRRLKPLNLEILPAEEHPIYDLERMTYESRHSAIHAQGIAALARALERVNLAWALAGMLMRLPGVNQLLQAIVDVNGGGRIRIERKICDASVNWRI